MEIFFFNVSIKGLAVLSLNRTKRVLQEKPRRNFPAMMETSVEEEVFSNEYITS
jgi:hypothetical protein